MDLTGVQQALQELTQLVDGWSASGRVDALERDLALEKLRRVYDALRFAPSGDALPEVPATAEPVGDVGAEPVSEAFEMPETLDLGEVLSLDPHSVADPEFQQAVPLDKVSEEPPLAAAVAGVEPEPEAEPADEPVADEPVAGLAPAAGAEAPAVAEPEVAAEPEPVPAAVAEPIAGREPAAADVPTPASESGPAAEPAVAPVSETQPIPETQPEPELRPAPDAEPSFVQPSAPAPAPETASETASERPHTAAPTLFGPEENANLRHRHKQRVIMSLYGNDAPSVKPQAPAVPEPTPAPAADRVAPAPERPSDERRAGRPSIAEVFGRRVETGPSAAFGRDLSEAPAALAEAVPDGTDAGESAEADPVVHGSFADELAAAAPGAVLGEVINHDVQTLADTIAPPRDRASELLRNEPVTDLRRAIGINDRFLLIRDLFGGDGAAYEAAIDALNGFDNLDDCMIYIAEHYAWNPNSDGAVLLMELLERKYL
ncbi:hypothetical protein [uncultured Alistipes sp.]|uniref:hypothetical protein n=1 Tax=uncultured Alistipes sp. TaxID=538949 RepID=UPI00266BEE9B|nr:hypothetical protein [uncultured Alistipes sp.]